MEVLVATAVLAIAIGPALDALIGGLGSDRVYAFEHQRSILLREKLDFVLSQEYDYLLGIAMEDQPSSTLSDTTDPASFRRTIGWQLFGEDVGLVGRLLVYVRPFDAAYNGLDESDPLGGEDDDLLWVRVEVEGTDFALESISGRE